MPVRGAVTPHLSDIAMESAVPHIRRLSRKLNLSPYHHHSGLYILTILLDFFSPHYFVHENRTVNPELQQKNASLSSVIQACHLEHQLTKSDAVKGSAHFSLSTPSPGVRRCCACPVFLSLSVSTCCNLSTLHPIHSYSRHSLPSSFFF